MARLFGRPIPDAHPAQRTLEEFLAKAAANSGSSGDGGAANEAVAKAQVCNLRHDGRVGPERETESELDWSSADAFQSSYGSYFDSKIRKANVPDFELDRHNDQNIVYRPGKKNRLHQGLFLVTLFDVSQLHELYSAAYGDQWKNSRGEQPFSGYHRNHKASSEWVAVWIERRMKDKYRRLKLIDATLEYMRTQLSKGRFFNPNWCALYDDLIKQPPPEWPLALGLGHWSGNQRWCFAVSYTVREAKIVAIPTVLDSRLNPYFFPTPPVANCGHPINISSSGADLIQEYINRQVPFYLENHEAANLVCQEIRISRVDLPLLRVRHWSRLEDQYHSAIDLEEWMPQIEAG